MGPSIRHGLKVQDDERNMKTAGGAGGKRVFRPAEQRRLRGQGATTPPWSRLELR